MKLSQPLDGLIVQEHGADIALAFCGKYLAGLGAKVHIAPGDRFADESAALSGYLDVGKTTGPPEADVDLLLATELGDDVAAGTVRVVVTDNGVVGPQAQWLGGELLAQASSGLMSLVGDPEREPLQIGGHQMDFTAGMMAFTGSMIALAARDAATGGEGQNVLVSRLEAGAYVEWKGRAYSQSGHELVRGDATGPVVVPTRDGFFGLYYRQSDWDNVVKVLDSPLLDDERFSTPAQRAAHRNELGRVLSSIAATRGSDELYSQFKEAGVPAGPVYAPDTLHESPQIRHRSLLQPVGRGMAPGLPLLINGVRPGEEAA